MPEKIIHRIKKERGISSLILLLSSRRTLNNIIYFNLAVVRVWIYNVFLHYSFICFFFILSVHSPSFMSFYFFLSFFFYYRTMSIVLSLYLNLFISLLISCTNYLGINNNYYLNLSLNQALNFLKYENPVAVIYSISPKLRSKVLFWIYSVVFLLFFFEHSKRLKLRILS